MRRAVALVLTVALAIVFGVRESSADVVLRPAEDGRLGAWLVAGPLPGGIAVGPPRSEPRLGEPIGNGAVARWRLLVGPASGLDLAKELGAKEREGARALVTSELRLDQDLDAWLMLSADGGVTVWVDGREIWARDVDRLRDRSWDAIPVKLAQGRHRLLLGLHQHGRSWAFAVRILDQKDLWPPKSLGSVLRGASTLHEAQLRERLVEASVDAEPEPEGYRLGLRLAFAAGFPAGAPVPVRAAVRREGALAPVWEGELGAIAASEHAMHPWAAALPRLGPEQLGPFGGDQRWEVLIQFGPSRLTRTLLLNRGACDAVKRGREAESGLRAGRFSVLDGRTLEATLQSYIERLGESAASTVAGTPAYWVQRIDALQAALVRGEDPLVRPGVRELARWSTLDGHPTPMLLHVPREYVPGTSRRFPLVILLHGYQGTPRGVLRAFLDTSSVDPQAKVDGFVLAPHAYGNSFYRGPGEQDVLDALDWVTRHYPIDPHKVSITGVSMGGTGAAHLGLLHADRFSAAAPLCGYQSYFVRRDTAGRPLRPWEIQRMHHWSPASWAANGRHLRLFVAQGTLDHPLSNSRVLVDAYRSLGYPETHEWPATGHAVWERIYAGQRMWPWLSGMGRIPSAPRITLTTDALRYGKYDWVRVTALDRSQGLVRLDVERASPDKVTVASQGVTGFELDRTEGGLDARRITVEVDGSTLPFGVDENVSAHRDRTGWHKGPPQRGERDKRAGVEGPLDDALLGPLIFVYGTLDQRWTRANQELASTLARQRSGVQLRYPVVSDREFDATQAATHSLVLVGNRDNHALLRRLDPKLPIGVVDGSVRVGPARHRGPNVGLSFIYPNPEHADHYLVLVEGTDLPGLYYALSLPQLLPDFIVYDQAVAPAAGQQVLGGGARVLAAGFFQEDWSLPGMVSDPLQQP